MYNQKEVKRHVLKLKKKNDVLEVPCNSNTYKPSYKILCGLQNLSKSKFNPQNFPRNNPKR